MAQICLQYIPLNNDVAFLRIKQDYVNLPYYTVAFFVHVFTALFALPAGLTQFSTYLRTRFPMFHRINGWLYCFVVILFAAPPGFVIGVFANGGLSAQIAFCLLAVLWFYYTIAAISAARKKQFSLHQKMMIRSFALALSAITLRLWKYILVALLHPKPMDVYQIVAWLGWVLNLMIAELIILNTIKK